MPLRQNRCDGSASEGAAALVLRPAAAPADGPAGPAVGQGASGGAGGNEGGPLLSRRNSRLAPSLR
eukprot:4328775-Prymnesium_polylepis.2